MVHLTRCVGMVLILQGEPERACTTEGVVLPIPMLSAITVPWDVALIPPLTMDEEEMKNPLPMPRKPMMIMPPCQNFDPRERKFKMPWNGLPEDKPTIRETLLPCIITTPLDTRKMMFLVEVIIILITTNAWLIMIFLPTIAMIPTTILDLNVAWEVATVPVEEEVALWKPLRPELAVENLIPTDPCTRIVPDTILKKKLPPTKVLVPRSSMAF
mmetsp:Transcript_12343/g.25598  ORF Transcript_12343/g.25598 Transcript_12343/m.25598 type:complete len:214 (+) Transcript_12343:1520-2161(+)